MKQVTLAAFYAALEKLGYPLFCYLAPMDWLELSQMMDQKYVNMPEGTLYFGVTTAFVLRVNDEFGQFGPVVTFEEPR